VAYAAKRYITVVPEIEMPGHASAAIAAYPQLSCFPEEPTVTYFPKNGVWAGDSIGKQVQQAWGVYADVYVPTDSTFKFIENVLDEVMALFPGKYIHVGGDECPKANWKRSAFCQQLMKEKGLKDEEELQSYFVQRVEKYINSKGKIMIGWDEILEGGLAPNAMVMSWRGEEGGIAAAKQHHKVIMTPVDYVYLNLAQSKPEDSLTYNLYLPLKKVYNYEPIPSALQNSDSSYVIGAQANVWTEYMTNGEMVEYMIFPRLSAMSEILWSNKAARNYDDFSKRLTTQFKRYNLWKVDYSKQFFKDMGTVERNK
jgi:hexosaminidase